MKLPLRHSTLPFLVITLLSLSANGLRQKDYVIVSSHLPDDVRFRPPIGNGHIATNVLSDTVYMNGLYNGHEDSSSRARIPAYVNVDVDVSRESDVTKTFMLDMYNGFFRQIIRTTNVNVNVTYFAHRKFPRLLVTQIDVKRQPESRGIIKLPLLKMGGKDSTDLTSISANLPMKDNGLGEGDRLYSGTILAPEVSGMQPMELYVYYTQVPQEVTLSDKDPSVTVTYIASHSIDQTDARMHYKQALDDPDSLFPSHSEASRALWDTGSIDLHDNEPLAKTVAAASYNIFCSLPDQDDDILPFFGLGPGGLSRGGLLYPEKPGGPRNDYAGHVFWDMDTWVMPAIMMFHPEMVRRTLGARTRVLDQIKHNARTDGYKGAKFPWEQASTGIEATPKWAGNMSLYEVHISADVSYAIRQYLYATGDRATMVDGQGFELALELARFWNSRVTRRDPDTLDIIGVMGPDEYHFNVNNSVFTNYNAILSLQLPRYIVNTLDIPMSPDLSAELDQFDRTASQIIILYDDELRYHPQYEDFNITVPIKQSDVVLLGYPLMMPMSAQVRMNDLQMYEQITDQKGPSTGTWSMHTVGWLELGDEDRARDAFNMMLRNVNEPFKVFSEKPVTNTSYGGCVNFITGAGGLLQAFLFGYGGLRLHPDELSINMTPPPNTSSWQLTGVHYKGARLNIRLENDDVTVELTTHPLKYKVYLLLEHFSERELQLSQGVTFHRQTARIQVKPSFPGQTQQSDANPMNVSLLNRVISLFVCLAFLHM